MSHALCPLSPQGKKQTDLWSPPEEIRREDSVFDTEANLSQALMVFVKGMDVVEEVVFGRVSPFVRRVILQTFHPFVQTNLWLHLKRFSAHFIAAVSLHQMRRERCVDGNWVPAKSAFHFTYCYGF